MLLITLALTLASTVPPPPPECTLPDGFRVKLELALTPEEQAMGLMFREKLEDDWGMLFVFPEDDYRSFWMKNTLVPLDMVWLDQDGKVVDVKADVQPCKLDPCPLYTPKGPGRAVVELKSGTAGVHGVKDGATLRFGGVSGFPVPRLPAPKPAK
jgi:uncharacterized protein